MNNIDSTQDFLCTVEANRSTGKDVHFDNVSIRAYKKQLLEDTELIISNGKKYGIIGKMVSVKQHFLDI